MAVWELEDRHRELLMILWVGAWSCPGTGRCCNWAAMGLEEKWNEGVWRIKKEKGKVARLEWRVMAGGFRLTLGSRAKERGGAHEKGRRQGTSLKLSRSTWSWAQGIYTNAQGYTNYITSSINREEKEGKKVWNMRGLCQWQDHTAKKGKDSSCKGNVRVYCIECCTWHRVHKLQGGWGIITSARWHLASSTRQSTASTSSTWFFWSRIRDIPCAICSKTRSCRLVLHLEQEVQN